MSLHSSSGLTDTHADTIQVYSKLNEMKRTRSVKALKGTSMNISFPLLYETEASQFSAESEILAAELEY